MGRVRAADRDRRRCGPQKPFPRQWRAIRRPSDRGTREFSFCCRAAGSHSRNFSGARRRRCPESPRRSISTAVASNPPSERSWYARIFFLLPSCWIALQKFFRSEASSMSGVSAPIYFDGSGEQSAVRAIVVRENFLFAAELLDRTPEIFQERGVVDVRSLRADLRNHLREDRAAEPVLVATEIDQQQDRFAEARFGFPGNDARAGRAGGAGVFELRCKEI